MPDERAQLPRSVVLSLISESIPSDLRTSQEFRNVLFDCIGEFIELASSEAMEVTEKRGKKLISAQFLLQALEDLGFKHLIPELQKAAADQKEAASIKRSKKKKNKITEEEMREMLEEQQRLFQAAREQYTGQ